jgi:hypothetical protein
MFQEISGQVQDSALRKRWPEKFRQLVKQATANGPAENLYVPADRFVQHFQTKGVDPYGIIDGLDGVTREDLDAALAHGGDLKIPTATYAEKIAGSEHDAFFTDNIRFHSDDMTAKQAAEFKAREEELLKETQKNAEAARIDESPQRAVEGAENDAKPSAASERRSAPQGNRRSAPSGQLKSMPKPAAASERGSAPQGSSATIPRPPMPTSRRSTPSSEQKTMSNPPAATGKRSATEKPRNDPKAAGANEQSRRGVKAVARDTKSVRAKRKTLRPANKLRRTGED